MFLKHFIVQPFECNLNHSLGKNTKNKVILTSFRTSRMRYQEDSHTYSPILYKDMNIKQIANNYIIY